MLRLLIDGRLKRQRSECVHMMGSVPSAGSTRRFDALPIFYPGYME